MKRVCCKIYKQYTLIGYYFDMFPLETRYNCLQQFRYAGCTGSIGYKSLLVPQHISNAQHISAVVRWTSKIPKGFISKGLLQNASFAAVLFGGNMWESNPPGRFLAPHNGFEDRGTQPAPIYSHVPTYHSICGHKKQETVSKTLIQIVDVPVFSGDVELVEILNDSLGIFPGGV